MRTAVPTDPLLTGASSKTNFAPPLRSSRELRLRPLLHLQFVARYVAARHASLTLPLPSTSPCRLARDAPASRGPAGASDITRNRDASGDSDACHLSPACLQPAAWAAAAFATASPVVALVPACNPCTITQSQLCALSMYKARANEPVSTIYSKHLFPYCPHYPHAFCIRVYYV